MPVTVDKRYGSTVYTVNDKQDKHQRVVLYAHGGAWFQDPLKIHFEFIDELAETLNAKVIMPGVSERSTSRLSSDVCAF